MEGELYLLDPVDEDARWELFKSSDYWDENYGYAPDYDGIHWEENFAWWVTEVLKGYGSAGNSNQGMEFVTHTTVLMCANDEFYKNNERTCENAERRAKDM